MDPQLLRERQAKRRTTVTSIFNATSEALVIERQPTPLHHRTQGYIYKSLIDFEGNPDSPIDCSTGKITFRLPQSDKACPESVINQFKNEQPDVCIKFPDSKGLESARLPDVFYDLKDDPCKNSRFSMYKGRANVDLWGIYDFKHYSRLINPDELIGQVIFEFLDSFIKPNTKVFLQALYQNIWGISVFLLNKIDLSNNPIVMCSRLRESQGEHQIIIDTTTNPPKIVIHNKINGVQFIDKNFRCPFCKSSPNPEGCCCCQIKIEEDLSFNFVEGCFFIEKSYIYNLTASFLRYITDEFKPPYAAQPVDLAKMRIIVVNNSPPSISGYYTKQLHDFHYYGSPIDRSGIILGQSQLDHADKIINLYNGLYELQPTIVVRKDLASRTISCAELTEKTGRVLNNPATPNRKYIICTFFKLLTDLVGDTKILTKLLNAYHLNIIVIARILFAKKLRQEMQAFQPSHTLIFDLDTQAIELINKYSLAQPQLTNVEEYLFVNEHGQFVVKEIIFPNISHQFMFDFIYKF